MNLLAQSPIADAIRAAEHMLIAVIREAGDGGMAFVWIGVGAVGMLLFLRLLKRMKIMR